MPRENPATGVYIFRDQPTIVLLTVCTLSRKHLLANHKVHRNLREAWKEADAWMVGSYVVMPDHLHLFCAPVNEDVSIEHWITYWKRRFHRCFGNDAPRFQSRGFHHRLRRDESYSNKWEYVRLNPVRSGLVSEPEDWPFQGTLNDLRW
jgi:REP-associated tyrosine transposase